MVSIILQHCEDAIDAYCGEAVKVFINLKMGVSGIDWICVLNKVVAIVDVGLKLSYNISTGNSEFDMLTVNESDSSSSDADEAIVRLLDGTGVVSSTSVELALAA